MDDFVLNLSFGDAEKPTKSPRNHPAATQKAKTDYRAPRKHLADSHAGNQLQGNPSVKSHPSGRGSGGRCSAGRGGRMGARGGGRGAKREERERRAPMDIEEIEMKGADDDEEGDVAAMVAAVSSRDKFLEESLASIHPSHSSVLTGVVEFDDDDDEHDAGRKRARLPQRQRQEGSIGGTADGKSKALPAATKAAEVIKNPGQLSRGAEVGSHAAGQVFGVASCGGKDLSWEGLGLCLALSQQLVASNFAQPTHVQQQSIPLLISRKDALVKAPTGSGKTLAFLCPIINDLQAQSPRISRAEGTYAVIISPTRELCIQIQDVAALILKRFVWLISSVLIGGENRSHEKARLRKGVTIVVATPGRLKDHLEHTSSFRAGELRWLVLDEADRLLDLGFQATLKEIIAQLDAKSRGSTISSSSEKKANQRTTVLLSATLHGELGALAAAIQHNPVPVGFTLQRGSGGTFKVGEATGPQTQNDPDAFVFLAPGRSSKGKHLIAPSGSGREGLSLSIPTQLKQLFIEVPCKDRLMALAGILRQKVLRQAPASTPSTIGPSARVGSKSKEEDHDGKAPEVTKAVGRKIIVFISTCDGVELHHHLLGPFWSTACGSGSPLLPAGSPLLKLHGDMPQSERTSAFLTFSKAKSAALICTDVAARGLDFDQVTNIVQIDVPSGLEEYVHRVGRTARMGHGGEAVILLMPHERSYVDMLASRGVSLREESLEGVLRWLPPPPDSEAKHMSKSFKQGGSSKEGGGMMVAGALHRAMMGAVAGDETTAKLAEDAFRSTVRAYATHPKELKEILHIRNLHLGHVAFSLGLRAQPQMIGVSGSSAERKRKKHESAVATNRQNKKRLYTNAGPKLQAQGNGVRRGIMTELNFKRKS